MAPSPVREGGPEILLGATGKKALARTGEFTDGVTTWSFSADAVETRAMFDVAEESWRVADAPGDRA